MIAHLCFDSRGALNYEVMIILESLPQKQNTLKQRELLNQSI